MSLVSPSLRRALPLLCAASAADAVQRGLLFVRRAIVVASVDFLSSTHDVAFFFTSTVFCELCCGCLPRLLSERRYREDHACTSTPYTAPPPSPPTSASPASSAALWTLCSPFVSHGHEAWIQHCAAIGVSHKWQLLLLELPLLQDPYYSRSLVFISPLRDVRRSGSNPEAVSTHPGKTKKVLQSVPHRSRR